MLSDSLFIAFLFGIFMYVSCQQQHIQFANKGKSRFAKGRRPESSVPFSLWGQKKKQREIGVKRLDFHS